MRPFVPVAFGLAALLLPCGHVRGAIQFSGIDEGGVGSATMDFVIDGNKLTVTLDNTSPTTLIDLSGPNSPGITIFGFDLVNPLPVVQSWTLTAFDENGSPAEIGASTAPIAPWSLAVDSQISGIGASYLLDNGIGSQNALYNPLAVTGLGPEEQYFTTAVLEMVFTTPPELDDPMSNAVVRMQNVGQGGEGSLKLHAIPEPTGIVVWSLLVCLGTTFNWWKRRS